MLRLLKITTAFLSVLSTGYGAVTVTSATTGWTAITYPGVQSDYFTDEQATSVEADLVGNGSYAAVYTIFDNGGTDSSTNATDGEIGFRFRVAGEKPAAGFDNVAWVGLAVNGVDSIPGDGLTDLDVFIGYDSGTNTIGVYDPGTGSNTSPNTTTIVSTPVWSITATGTTLDWSSVDSIDLGLPAADYNLDGGNKGGVDNTDHFLTFKIDFSLLSTAISGVIGTTFNDESTFGIVSATATQTNSLNQDLNGVDGDVNDNNSTLTWDTLKAVSPLQNSQGDVVPEPATIALLLGGIAFACVLRRRSRG